MRLTPYVHHTPTGTLKVSPGDDGIDVYVLGADGRSATVRLEAADCVALGTAVGAKALAWLILRHGTDGARQAIRRERKKGAA